MRAARFAVACLAAGLFAACGLAVNGLETTPGDGGPGGLDATGDVTRADGSVEASSSGADTGGGVDTGNVDTGTTADVGTTEASPVDGCVPKGPESCTNGVDDDCNGLVDCADPACSTQGYTCVAMPAAGWNIVAFDATSQAACPPGLMQKAGDVDPTSLPPAVCGCGCSVGSNPSCVTGNIAGSGGSDNTCSMGSGNLNANGGMCVNDKLPVTAYVQATLPGPTGGTCTPAATVSKPSTGATSGEYCSGESAFGAGCSGTEVCALVPAGFQACVEKGGTNATCPAPGYPTAHVIGMLQDNRGCGPCMCGPPSATCDGTWNFYSAMNCTGQVGVAATANGVCDATNNANLNAYFQSYMVVASPTNVTCANPAAPPPTGTVMLNGADTVCCE